MECSHSANPSQPPPAAGGRFAWTGLWLAILAAPLFGLIWAWVAVVLQAYVAPIILFPVLLGVFVGLSIVGLARFAQMGNRPTIFLAAVLAAAVAASVQHYFGYLAAEHGARPALDTTMSTGQDLPALIRQVSPGFGQHSFREYMQAQARGRPLAFGLTARGWLAWLSWAIDGLLVVAGAVAVTIPALWVPYCNRCGTWYRTIRNGKIDLPTARRLADLLGVDGFDHARSPRFRLSTCQGGCGPTRCELSWEEPDGGVSLACVWLDAASRNQVAAILDGLESANPKAESLNEE
jgi:hypothetical protein